ncbi:M48 family metalloprotease [Pseudoduganella sp. DS3]|uniref:M48 family metalloprotease n=1 Tax=Pseudoduganella guangdongensis TaxID=2692179 RepID=A0A6N9HGD6_9BURK|nr:M48 family metalloprotease [Pseudoduganella guangdongensis]MYN02092.1 M48 family metalloprotease [Pseudoduganella guangdongensis]
MRPPAARAAIAALLFALGAAAPALGQVTQAQVIAGAGKLYAEQLAQLRAGHRLDDNARFGERVAAIAKPLIEQAKRDYPESASWPWELHTTSDEAENAFAMAGGKLLVGAAFVDRLVLNDAELAMLLAHEMAHAVLQHNLREAEEAMRLEPHWAERPYAELEHAIDHDYGLMRKLAQINFIQEEEADREGMRLAVRAGWQPAALARFFRKLERHSHAPNFRSLFHPSPAMRVRAANQLAAALEAGR